MKRSALKLVKKVIETGEGILPLLERRGTIRHRTKVKARVRVLESTRWADVSLDDLSRTGGKFQGLLGAVPGVLVVVQIELEELGKLYELFGLIVWRRKGSFGVQFL